MFSLFVGDDDGIESNRLIEWSLAPEVSQWQLRVNRVGSTVVRDQSVRHPITDIEFGCLTFLS
jgi:hypothetical protein